MAIQRHGKFQLLMGDLSDLANSHRIKAFEDKYLTIPPPDMPDPTAEAPRQLCKCVWKTKCEIPAWKDGWCCGCYYDHREGR